MKIVLTKIGVCLLFGTLSLVAVECSKYTSKELEELRRFYYDDPDDYNDKLSSDEKHSTQRKHPGSSSTSRKPESRSSSKHSVRDGEKQSSSEGEGGSKERTFRPRVLIDDARKFLDAGRRTIDRTAHEILPLPRIRIIRDSSQFKLPFGKRDTLDDHGENDYIKDRSYSDSPETFKDSGKSDNTKSRGRGFFRNPFKNVQNDASRVVADTGGKILSILNRLTPPPILGLPTPLPNLEDFGG